MRSHVGRTAVSIRIKNEPKIAHQRIPLEFLMIVGAILGTVEPILGNVRCIVTLYWENLGATWVHLGACKSKVKKTYAVERCDGPSTPDMYIKPLCVC